MANPVGTMFIELSLDATKYTRAQQEILNGAEKNSADIEKTFKTVGITSDKMYDAMRQNVKNAYEAIKQSATSTQAEIERASAASAEKLKKIDEKQFGEKNSLIDKMKENWEGALLAIGAVAGAVAGVKSLASSFIDTASSMERYRITLNQTMGDTQKGGQVFDEMVKFAAKTPFTFDEIIKSATTLSGVLIGGLPELKKYLPIIGDIASTYNMTFEEATSNFVRFFSVGANAADLFQTKGVNAMLGLKAGITINSEESMAALMKHYEAVDSKFRGVTEKLSVSWTGTISMFEDTWTLFKKTVMDAGVFDSVKWGLQEILKGIQELQKSGDITAWAKTIGASLITSFQMIISTVGILHETWLTFMTVVKTGVERLVVGIVSLIQGVITPMNFLFNSMAKLGVIAKNPLDGINTVLKDIKDATKETTSQAVKSQKDTALAYGTVLGKLDDYKKKIFEVEDTHIDFSKKVIKNEKKVTEETEEELKKRLDEEKKAKKEAGKILDDYYEDYQKAQQKSLEDGLKELEKDRENQTKVKELLSKDLNKIDDQYFENIRENYKQQAREYRHALADDPTSVAKVAEWLDEKLRKTDADFIKYKIENYEKLSDNLVKKDEEYWNLRKLDLENQAKEFEKTCNSQELAQKNLNENLKKLSIERTEDEITRIKSELNEFSIATTGKMEKNATYWQLRKAQIDAEATLYAIKTGDMTKADTQRKEQFLLLKIEEAKASDDFFGGMKAQMEYTASKDEGAGAWAKSVSSFLKTPFEDGEGQPMEHMKNFFSEVGLGLAESATGSEKSFKTWGEAGAAMIADVGKKGGNLFNATVSDSMVALMKGDMDAFQSTWEKYWSNLGQTILKKIADELTELAVSKAFAVVVDYAGSLFGGSGSGSGSADAGTRGAVGDVATGVGTTVAGKVIGGKILGEGAGTGVGTGVGTGILDSIGSIGAVQAGVYGAAALAIGGSLYGLYQTFSDKGSEYIGRYSAEDESALQYLFKVINDPTNPAWNWADPTAVQTFLINELKNKTAGEAYASASRILKELYENFPQKNNTFDPLAENKIGIPILPSQEEYPYLPTLPYIPPIDSASIPNFDVGGRLELKNDQGFFVGKRGEIILTESQMATLSGAKTDRPLHIAIEVGGEHFEKKITKLADNIRVKAERRKIGAERMIH